MTRSVKRSSVVIALVLSATAILWVVLRNGQANQLDATPAPPEIELAAGEVTRVQRGELVDSLRISGTLVPVNQVVVKAKVAAEILEVLVREGESVSAGQTLVKLDTADLAGELAQRQGNLRAGIADLRLAETDLRKKKSLIEQHYISQFEYDSAVRQVERQRAGVEALSAAAGVAKTSVERATVVAPIAGIVSVRSVNPGEKVSIDTTLLTVVDVRTMELDAPVPLDSVARVRPGQKASFTADGFADRMFSGEVTRINPTTESGGSTIMVHIAVNNAAATLRGGMFASGTIVIDRAADVLTLPASSVSTSGETSAVYLLSEGQLILRPITLGRRDDVSGIVEIATGVTAGDVVVTAPTSDLRVGQTVTIAGS